jgi:hypothetical protein
MLPKDRKLRYINWYQKAYIKISWDYPFKLLWIVKICFYFTAVHDFLTPAEETAEHKKIKNYFFILLPKIEQNATTDFVEYTKLQKSTHLLWCITMYR